jgi:glycosyltransferase involved in cell wall biosynthesis
MRCICNLDRRFFMTPALVRVPKIALCVTEDWFVLSHFKPLIRALRTVADEVVIVTNDTGRLAEVADLGARVTAFDFDRKSTHPLAVMSTTRKLAALLAVERPSAVHLVALKPIILGILAAGAHGQIPLTLHLTGLGLLAVAPSVRAQIIRRLALGIIGRALRRPTTQLFIENADDLALVTRLGADPGSRATILGGAGVDPTHFAALPLPATEPPRIAFAGRMIKSKGIDVLVEAARLLRTRGQQPVVHLYGQIDAANPEAFTRQTIAAWQAEGLVLWHGHANDVRGIWRDAAIFVAPSLGGEGMPRTMLEAAACARPLIVTDVPGCRHFVRDGIDGLVVPPGDAAALADALARLLAAPELRVTLAQAARARVLDGFTEAAVEAAVSAAYRQHLKLLA